MSIATDLLLWFMGGVVVGIWLASVSVVLGQRRARRAGAAQLAWMRGMVDALDRASANARAALQRGDVEASEHYAAEFWAISAELDLHFKKYTDEKKDK
jgi:hypothetical protein